MLWKRVMFMERKKELSIKDIQKILLNTYKVVDDICKKHNWKLFLTGGSVLGAVRHQGFIPWDDDMDLALPREDYEKFAQIAPKELPDYLQLVWMKRPHHYKLADIRYEMKLNSDSQKAMNEGDKSYVSIDIQPFDGLPTIKLFRLEHCMKVMYYRVSYIMCNPQKICIGRGRKKWELFLIFVLKKFSFCFKKEEESQNKFDRTMRRYNYGNSEYIADFVGKYKFRDTYPKSWWEPGIMVAFEGVQVRIPSEYDKYLSRIYGDYMKIPDEKEQITHRELANRSS